MRRLALPALLALLAAPLAAQPFPSAPAGPGGYRPGLDVQRYAFALTLSDASDRIEGEAAVAVRFTAAGTDPVVLDLVDPDAPGGPGMTVSAVTEDGQPVDFEQAADQLRIRPATPPAAGDVRTYTVTYAGTPADGLIISTNRHGDRTFFGDNWPNRARHWLPTVDHPSDKALVAWAVTAPERYQVVASGRLVEETDLPGGLRLTRWASMAPLAPKIAVLGAADFAVEHLAPVGGTPVQSWVYPQDRAAGFHDFERAARVLQVFELLLGEYPFAKLANVQSTTRYGGMENASNIFYDENSVTGTRANEGLVAHEVAHQWFGNAVTEADWPHLWLSEGFATYLTHVFREFTYGRDALAAGLAADRETVRAFVRSDPQPVVDSTYTDPTELLTPNSYQRGAWVLHLLRRRVGDEAFFEGLRTYYARFRGGNATTADFRRVMEEVSGQDLERFFWDWTARPGLPRLEGSWHFEAEARRLTIELRQTHENTPFALPLEVGIVTEGGTRVETLELSEPAQTFTLELDAAPLDVVLDPNVNALFEGDALTAR